MVMVMGIEMDMEKVMRYGNISRCLWLYIEMLMAIYRDGYEYGYGYG